MDETRMKRTVHELAISVVWSVGVLASVASGADYVIESRVAQRIEATLTQEIKAPGLDADEWVAFIAKPPELPSQGDIKVASNPAAKEVADLSDLKRTLMMIRAPGRTHNAKDRFDIRATYRATLHARRLKKVNSGVPQDGNEAKPQAAITLSEEDKTKYLARGSYFDIESAEFQDWVKSNDLMREDDESDIDFARRVFSAIKSNFKYDYRAEMDRRASNVCKDKQSDCGGLSVLFVSVLRANGIPARVLVGRWAISGKPGQKLNGIAYQQHHVKAEFFAEGVGWAPIDMASAVLHDPRGDGMQYFGNDRGDFITMHIDPDVIINTIHFGRKQTPWLQGVTFWVTGQGDLKNLTTQERWVVKQIDNDKPLATDD
jgi:hypothetical protein